MNTTGKVAIVTGVGLSTAVLYYFFVYRKNKTNATAAAANIAEGINAANSNVLFPNIKLADLKNQIWLNSRKQDVSANIKDYDPSSGIVSHVQDGWHGILLDPSTIQWTSSGGATDIWKGAPRQTSLTIADLKNQVWRNSQGQDASANLRDYDPSTGVVTHAEPLWRGLLLDPHTIQWTNILNGRKDTWKGTARLSGLGYALSLLR